MLRIRIYPSLWWNVCRIHPRTVSGAKARKKITVPVLRINAPGRLSAIFGAYEFIVEAVNSVRVGVLYSVWYSRFAYVSWTTRITKPRATKAISALVQCFLHEGTVTGLDGLKLAKQLEMQNLSASFFLTSCARARWCCRFLRFFTTELRTLFQLWDLWFYPRPENYELDIMLILLS